MLWIFVSVLVCLTIEQILKMVLWQSVSVAVWDQATKRDETETRDAMVDITDIEYYNDDTDLEYYNGVQEESVREEEQEFIGNRQISNMLLIQRHKSGAYDFMLQ